MDVRPLNKILKQGEKVKLTITPYGGDGLPIDDLFYESSIDEPEMGKIGRKGWFTAGGQSGTTTIRIIYGKKDNQQVKEIIQISEEKIKKEGGGDDGPGIPHILMCRDLAPGFDDLPEEQRTHAGGEDFPTIIDFEPVWEDKIIWINPTSKESLRVRKNRPGTSGVMRTSTKSFKEFLALKCFDILKRLKVKLNIGENTITYTEYLQEFAGAEIETSDFLKSAYDLVDNLIGEDE